MTSQCKLSVKQQGAGNGKTYGLIQAAVSEEFDVYDNIIVLAKQHSVKTIINSEFISQLNNGQIRNISDSQDVNNKYIIY